MLWLNPALCLLAIACRLGGNPFDTAIRALADRLYRPGPRLARVSPAHLSMAFSAARMAGLFLSGRVLRRREQRLDTVGRPSRRLTALLLVNAHTLCQRHAP